MEKENTKTIEITCKCGVKIPDNNIEYWNTSNEIGEDYCVIQAICNDCGKEYEAADWGEWDSKNEAYEYLQEYITKDW